MFLENIPLTTGPVNWALRTFDPIKLNSRSWESGIRMSDWGQLMLDTWVKVLRRTAFVVQQSLMQTRKPSKRRLDKNMLGLEGEGKAGSSGLLNQPCLERESGMKEAVGTTQVRPYPVRPGGHKSPASPPGIRSSGPGPDVSIPPQWRLQPHLQMIPMPGKSKRSGGVPVWVYCLVSGKSPERPKAWITEYLLRTKVCAGLRREVDGAFDRTQRCRREKPPIWESTGEWHKTVVILCGLWVHYCNSSNDNTAAAEPHWSALFACT